MSNPPLTDDYSPSQAHVLYVLDREGPLTAQALADEAVLAEQTVYGALTDLREAGAIERRPLPTNPGTNEYHIAGRL